MRTTVRDEPSNVHRLTITAGSPADGRSVADLTDLPGDAWVSFIVREGQLLPIKADTALRAVDDALILAGTDLRERLIRASEGPPGKPLAGKAPGPLAGELPLSLLHQDLGPSHRGKARRLDGSFAKPDPASMAMK